jgi:phosphate-selective porin OprO/OprP
VERLEARLRAMEEANRKLAKELETTRSEHAAQLRQILDRLGERPPGTNAVAPGTAAGGGDGRSAARGPSEPGGTPNTPVSDYTEEQFRPYTTAPGFLGPPDTAKKLPLKATFGPGFEFQTDDDEFRLQTHVESQVETRIWSPTNDVRANSGFFLPRQRFYFNGNIFRPIEYEFAINRGVGGSINLLNAFVNLHFNDRFQFKMGRYFAPLMYDQFAIANFWLPTPERSLFTTNLGTGRQFGAMAWGYLADKRISYAAGAFNGSRNVFENLDNGVEFTGYLNVRPFQESKAWEFLNAWNIGASVDYGGQNQAPVPVAYRLGGLTPNADNLGPGTTPFLTLNSNVLERGPRLLGSVHSAYFYKGLSLIGEWQYGYGGYATNQRPESVRVPFWGFYVTGAYFLTGEHVAQRTRVRPLRPLIGKKGDPIGPGAWEIVGRFSTLNLGEQIFTGGFADPNLWSRQAATTELGLNWYWNEYIKIYMFWLHGHFGDPVFNGPGSFMKSDDMFWLRFQLYF